MSLPPIPKLPVQLPVKATLFGDGRDGYKLQIRENKKFGVQVVSVRESSDAEWKHELTITCLPDQTFASYAEMLEAIQMLE